MSLDQPAAFVKHQTATRDGFLGARLMLTQPGTGFRAGLDSILLGAAIAPGSRSVLDLGAGAGAAALVALAHAPERSALLLDNDPAMLDLAKTNIAENGFAERAETLLGDITQAPELPSDHFTSVIANPPFFAKGQGTTATTRGADARQMDAGELELWARLAAGAAAPGGEIIFVHAAEALPELLAAFVPRFGAVTILPLCPRPNTPATRVLVRGKKGSRTPLLLLSAWAMHSAEGNGFAPAVDAVLRGTGRIDW